MVSRAALRSGLVGPLVTQVAVGLLVRPPEFFNPLFFVSTLLVAIVLLGPGSILIGAGFAEIGGHMAGRQGPRAVAILAAGTLGMLAGLFHVEVLSLVLHSPTAPLGWEESVTLPALRVAFALGGEASAALAVFTAYRDRPPMQARLRSGALRAPFPDRT